MFLLLSNANEHKGSSNGNIFNRPWHDKIKCRLEIRKEKRENREGKGLKYDAALKN